MLARLSPVRPAHGRMVQQYLESWLAARREVEPELRGYLECGILACGFARARCGACGHDFLVAFSCKGRGLCPSCTTRRMAETAAQLVEHVFPQVPVRQWVVTFPRRLRFFLHRNPALLGRVRRSVLRAAQRPHPPALLRHRRDVQPCCRRFRRPQLRTQASGRRRCATNTRGLTPSP